MVIWDGCQHVKKLQNNRPARCAGQRNGDMGRVSTCQKNCKTIDLRGAQVNKCVRDFIATWRLWLTDFRPHWTLEGTAGLYVTMDSSQLIEARTKRIFKGIFCTVEIWEWISNSILYFVLDVIIYPLKLIHVNKRGPKPHWVHDHSEQGLSQ